ncbi:hypothetical protein KUTeg_015941 [Tegillarca granosa]|uniref:Uncharacterized protein n=1 Tax=Tegillarca granosa TaxID=220873 RepID=A0ABQ9ENC1_TEGGR|nr:hypothetical protein KUTeg_015941 [Tegillarca granosa]
MTACFTDWLASYPMNNMFGFLNKIFILFITATPQEVSPPHQETVSAETKRITKRMISPPPESKNRLSKKVASITCVTALHSGDEVDFRTLEQSAQILVTVKQENIAPKGAVAVSKGLLSKDGAKKLCGEGFSVTTITQSQAVFGDGDLSSIDSAIGLG